MTKQKAVIMDAKSVERALTRIAHEIVEKNKGTQDLLIVGIKRRGDSLGRKIARMIGEIEKTEVPYGALDITFYRDDLATRGVLPAIKETSISFDISTMTILLVDDVIFTGRTAKAALETLTSFGRPKAIRLFVLVDRGNRELPIQPDYRGFTLETAVNDTVDVMLGKGGTGEDAVYLARSV